MYGLLTDHTKATPVAVATGTIFIAIATWAHTPCHVCAGSVEALDLVSVTGGWNQRHGVKRGASIVRAATKSRRE